MDGRRWVGAKVSVSRLSSPRNGSTPSLTRSPLRADTASFWAVGQEHGLLTVTLILTDEQADQLIPIFETHEGITKIRIAETK